MSILEKLFLAAKAVKAGESLKNPANWKKKQLVFDAILVILAAIVKFADLPLSDEDLNSISYGIATLLGVINIYFIPATTDKIGL